MVNGYRKGGPFELQVARAFSVWMGGGAGTDDSLFKRNLTTISIDDSVWVDAGDLLVQRRVKWPWTVEVKNREEWGELDGFFHRDSWPVFGYWKQACERSKKNGLAPMLVLKRNRRESLVMLECGVLSDTIFGGLPLSSPRTVMAKKGFGEVCVVGLSSLIRVPKSRVKNAFVYVNQREPVG